MERMEHLSDASRVWIYTSPRELSNSELDFVLRELDIFTANWAAHGSQLRAKGTVLENRFIVLAADESKTGASGCSIDTSVQFMKALGSELGLDLFNRMYFYSESMERIHFSDLESYQGKIFNSLVTCLGDLRTNWLVETTQLFAAH